MQIIGCYSCFSGRQCVEQEHGAKVAEDPAPVFVVQRGHQRGRRPVLGLRTPGQRAAAGAAVAGRLGLFRAAAVAAPTPDGRRRVEVPSKRAHHWPTVVAAPAEPAERGVQVHILRAIAPVADAGRRHCHGGRRGHGPLLFAGRVRPVRRPAVARGRPSPRRRRHTLLVLLQRFLGTRHRRRRSRQRPFVRLVQRRRLHQSGPVRRGNRYGTRLRRTVSTHVTRCAIIVRGEGR